MQVFFKKLLLLEREAKSNPRFLRFPGEVQYNHVYIMTVSVLSFLVSPNGVPVDGNRSINQSIKLLQLTAIAISTTTADPFQSVPCTVLSR